MIVCLVEVLISMFLHYAGVVTFSLTSRLCPLMVARDICPQPGIYTSFFLYASSQPPIKPPSLPFIPGHSIIQNKLPPILKIFPPRRSHPRPKDRALDLHIGLVKRAHDGLDVVLVDLGEEVLDGLLGLRAGRVCGDGGRVSRGGCRLEGGG